MIHSLKCDIEYFAQSKSGDKPFELRKDDRPYEVGDIFINQEYDPKTEKYTGDEAKFEITYILRDAAKFGLKPGYCILGLIPVQEMAFTTSK